MPSFFEHEGRRLAYTVYGEGPRTTVLLHGLLLAKPDVDALTYQDAVSKEGTIVSVTVRSDDEEARATEALQASGAVRVARLPQEGLED